MFFPVGVIIFFLYSDSLHVLGFLGFLSEGFFPFQLKGYSHPDSHDFFFCYGSTAFVMKTLSLAELE